jgi:hypothetical protein
VPGSGQGSLEGCQLWLSELMLLSGGAAVSG